MLIIIYILNIVPYIYYCLLQVLSSLMFFGSGSLQWVVGQDLFIGLSQPSVSRSIHKVVDAIERRMLKKEISFPYPREYPALKQKFMESSGFPGVIGAIDCTHVEIIAPKQPMDVNYIDRRGDYSLNVQLVSMIVNWKCLLKYLILVRKKKL